MISFARVIYSLTIFDVRFGPTVSQSFERNFVDEWAVSSTYSRGVLPRMQIPEENLRANVVITPHIAFSSEEALQRILDVTAENVRVPLRRPQNLIGDQCSREQPFS